MVDKDIDQWRWETANDANEVHDMLEQSDRSYSASGVPQRSRTRTQELVEAGSVHLLRQGGSAIAMFTLTSRPPFRIENAQFGYAEHPVYLQRLAVKHTSGPSPSGLVGLCAIRHCIEVAHSLSADAVRSEVNPDIANVVYLLSASGFSRGPTSFGESGLARAYMELKIGG